MNANTRKMQYRSMSQICNYCGEEIKKKESRDYEQVDGVEAYYHLICGYEVRREGKTLKQLMKGAIVG